MKRIALYGRYSTDMQNCASINDQFRNCEKLVVEHEDWQVAMRYSDEGITGAISQRPGFNRMLRDAEEGLFDILVVDELSRFYRHQAKQALVIEKLMFQDVRIITADRRYDSNHAGHKMNAMLEGFQDERAIEKISYETHRGLSGKVDEGYSHGGRCYGYYSEPIYNSEKRSRSGGDAVLGYERKIDAEEAKWVRKIFEWYADGKTARWIAGELNKLAVPSARGGTWSSSSIYGVKAKHTGMLNNDLYIGTVIWNKRKWMRHPDTGRRIYKERPEHEWKHHAHPELRIISDELWARVHKRKNKTHLDYAEGKRGGIPTGAAPHKHLFSGLVACGMCGSSYSMVANGRYGCTGHRNRGNAFCLNSRRVSRNILEKRLLDGLKNYIFTEESVSVFTQEIRRLIDVQKSERGSILSTIKKQMRDTEQEITNIMNAIKAGIITQTTKSQLESAERLYAELSKKYENQNTDIDYMRKLLPEARNTLTTLVNNLNSALKEDTDKARNILSQMIYKKITLHPTEQGHLEARIQGDYSVVVELIEGIENIVEMPQPCNQNTPRNHNYSKNKNLREPRNHNTGITCNHHPSDDSAGCGGRI